MTMFDNIICRVKHTITLNIFTYMQIETYPSMLTLLDLLVEAVAISPALCDCKCANNISLTYIHPH